MFRIFQRTSAEEITNELMGFLREVATPLPDVRCICIYSGVGRDRVARDRTGSRVPECREHPGQLESSRHGRQPCRSLHHCRSPCTARGRLATLSTSNALDWIPEFHELTREARQMLKQLSGMDSMFLYAEKPSRPARGRRVADLRPVDVAQRHRALQGTARNLSRIVSTAATCSASGSSRFRCRSIIPTGSYDDDFDLEYHVRHISLPKPGDWQQLMSQVARLQARQLDHSKPLWMAHIIEGLDNIEGLPPGCFAMFLKMHHSTIDGVTGQSVQAAMHDLEALRQADASTYKPSTGPHRRETTRARSTCLHACR